MPGHSLFLTWEWLYYWAKHYLGQNQLRILRAFDDHERLVGIAPFYLRRAKAHGVIPFRELRFLGSEAVCSSYLDVITNEQHKPALFQSLYRYLFDEARTHMRIVNSQREAETVRVFGNPFNRVDVEAGVFQHDNMQFLNGEYEAFISGAESQNEIVMKVRVEAVDLNPADRRAIEDRFVERFLKHRRELAQCYVDHRFTIVFDFVGAGELELHRLKGRPKRLVDRRSV